MIEKLYLIEPPVDNYEYIPRHGLYPPLNLLALGSYVSSQFPNVNIEIIDSSINNIFNKITKIEPKSFVGISPKINSFNSTVKIANLLKGKNCTVFLGGYLASNYTKSILNRYRTFDFIIRGDGEIGLHDLIIGKPLYEIPNVSFIDDGKIINNKTVEFPLRVNDKNFMLKYELIKDLDIYFDNFRNKYSSYLQYSRNGIFYSSKGCPWGKCNFCFNNNRRYRYKSAEQFWVESKYLYSNYNFDFLWDVSDSFTSDKKRFRKIVATRPKNQPWDYYFYSRVPDLTEENIDKLKSINAKELFVGFESADDEILLKMNKGFDSKNFHKIASILDDRNIFLYPAFILGGIGETKYSLDKTADFIKFLAEKNNVFEISLSLLTPFPGTLIYKNTFQNEKFDFFITNKKNMIIKEFIESRTNLKYKYLINYSNRLIESIKNKVFISQF